MGTDAFIACNENIKQLGLDKAINILFHRFAIGFSQCQRLDNAWTQPLDKFIFPILDETTWTNDNDAFGCRFTLCCNACFEQCVNQTHRLQRLAQTYYYYIVKDEFATMDNTTKEKCECFSPVSLLVGQMWHNTTKRTHVVGQDAVIKKKKQQFIQFNCEESSCKEIFFKNSTRKYQKKHNKTYLRIIIPAGQVENDDTYVRTIHYP